MNKTIITFKKLGAINLNPGPIETSEKDLIDLVGLLGRCGYVLSDEFKGHLDATQVLEDLEEYLKKAFGLGKIWRSVYKTPGETLGRTKEQLKFEQGCLYINPELLEEIREGQVGDENFWEVNNIELPDKILRPLKDDSELKGCLKSLLGSGVALGGEDSEILDWCLDNLDDIEYPETIGTKETLCKLLSRGMAGDKISSVNDILRVVTYLSYHDPAISTIPKKDHGRLRMKLTNPQRKIILGLLERYLGNGGDIEYKLEDSKKYYGKWIVLGQILHVKESKYPRSRDFFNALSNKGDWWKRNWSSKLQRAYDKAGEHGSLKGVIEVLKMRPGELLRHYDSVLRRAWENKDTSSVDALQEAILGAQGLHSKTLLELSRYYDRRNLEIQRSYLDSHGVRQYYKPLGALDDDLIVIAQEMIKMKLKDVWSKYNDQSGKEFYLDIPGGTNIPLSFKASQEGQVNTKMTLPGEKIYLEGDILRFFTQWIDPEGNQDLDLHAWLVNEDFSKTEFISWESSFVDETRHIAHSGDVRFVQGDCAEYVTIDTTKKLPYKWVLITVQNFERPSMLDLECYAGYSEVTGMESEEGWVPGVNDLKYRTSMNVDSKNVAAFIVNLEERWLKVIMEGINENVLYQNQDVFKGYAIEPGIDLRTALGICIEAAGGKIVEEPGEETKIISQNNFESYLDLLFR